ncbi:MAG: hypothetical protein A2504_15510 [Bdellovibrionales bacterium RIFOXYD12_FULL_39_22]|nr:MAG: hypothetical protein A2385_02940 [Bdellovibrionales bacterium RIFOXYB1_FULL_39_21]OFZ43200.1 MAG: hypothetical protein A2485_12085 [Bdellovibrionales bacterium RIFOXYC12_FULL_39_17]OFZ47938.1 MAG: hypothetical protein A2404_16725 [Bdellovibrionales bacterium RIFOXYC1_FULL_39_130]OFZ71645.1 MAG: hypothetical protein A2451_11035 [Bdellovibrionales bacterium RIFOXYC2_FULL_39_8]OFZ75718.1 MAG: hypothetical protein A2560_13225 [Bdellovibrionales bacterium RIFOXYD1_FULL_39_84]OFZ94208.1 MAG:
MTSAKQLFVREDILLFKNHLNDKGHCHLKTFINFLNYNHVKRPLKFAYISSNHQLIEGLTLKENILLDYIPSDLSTSKEHQFNSYMQKSENTHLQKLFAQITLPDAYPSKVDRQMQQLAVFIKGLIQQSDFLFLERPEEFLSSENIVHIINAIEFNSKNSGQVVLLSTTLSDKWFNHITKIVTKSSAHCFEVAPVINQKSIIKIADHKKNVA